MAAPTTRRNNAPINWNLPLTANPALPCGGPDFAHIGSFGLAATAAAGAVARGAGTAVGTTDALFALLFGPPDIPPGQGQNGGDDA